MGSTPKPMRGKTPWRWPSRFTGLPARPSGSSVGRVMIGYGESPSAEINNIPNHYAETLVEEGEEAASGKLLQTKCALRELLELLDWARLYKPDLALVDGSLMQL